MVDPLDIVRALAFGVSISTVSIVLRIFFPSYSFASTRRVSLEPPGWVFGIVWPLLYVLTGAAWVMMDRSVSTDVMLSVVTCLCCAWLPTYVLAKYYVFATVILILSTGISAATVILSKSSFKWLLAPLVVWLSFATYLSVSKKK